MNIIHCFLLLNKIRYKFKIELSPTIYFPRLELYILWVIYNFLPLSPITIENVEGYGARAWEVVGVEE